MSVCFEEGCLGDPENGCLYEQFQIANEISFKNQHVIFFSAHQAAATALCRFVWNLTSGAAVE
jgi:hypothetical protein